MKKIGFFGGCFNPPTIAHLEMAKLAIKEIGLDKVIFVPMNDFYNKMGLISSNHRINMLNILINGNTNLEVNDFEIKANKKMFAIDAFDYIDKNYDCEKYFIMGSDNYIKINNWKDSYKLEKFNYIILDRLHEIKVNDKISIVSNNNYLNISSTKVRNLILKKEDTKNYLTNEVYQYIKTNKLYC